MDDLSLKAAKANTLALHSPAATCTVRCLPEVWQRYPNHQVFILTDSASNLPAYIPDSCRARTSALLIGLENYSDEQREEILAVAETIAGNVVEVLFHI